MIKIISDRKPTNADRIRGMSDEELSKFIESVRCCLNYGDDDCCDFLVCQSMNGNFCNGINDKEPDKDILEWLQQQEIGRAHV